MRLLLDSCISRFAVEALRENHYHVVWIPEEGADPGDTQILNRAFQEKRVLVTADKDFGDLVFVFQQPHPAIIRLVNLKAKAQASAIYMVLERYNNDLSNYPLITVDDKRIRIKYPNN